VFAVAATAPASRIGTAITLAAAATSQTEDPDDTDNQASAQVGVIEDPLSAIPELFDGVPVAGLSGAQGDAVVYRIEVPDGARVLRLMSLGGSGDVTLYAGIGRVPTPAAYDLRSQRPGNNETITVPRPQAGTWYVVLVGERAFGNVGLRGNINP
jgi:uncharacterized protein